MFANLEDQIFDVLIIGAGITGCGVARDLAMRGVRVALVDANDIAAGTSSRSSKLIHGGIRYLTEGHINLVREAARERKAVRRIAPHLSRPTRLIVPGRSKATLLKFRAGLVTYEKLGQIGAEEKHETWDAEQVAREEPSLKMDDIAGAVVYPEYLTDDSRLTLANARSAAEHGAVVGTYAPVTVIQPQTDGEYAVTIGDAIAGDTARATVKARCIVNAAGPWVDAVRAIEDESAPAMLQLTKGIHVTVSRECLPINHTVIMSTPDKRSIFAVPRDGFVYFGTTDTFYPDSDYWPAITNDDIAYLMDVASATFNEGPFSHDDIVSLWSGIRPLIAEEGKTPSEISRKNEIFDGPKGVITIAGGKLTSFRSMAERIADMCQQRLDMKPQPARTGEEPLPGGDCDFDDIVSRAEAMGFEGHAATRAARLYGSELDDVFADGIAVAQEAIRAVTHEGAVTLEDYWVRRSNRARFDEEGGINALPEAAAAMAPLLGWNDQEQQRQVDACKARRAEEFACVHDKQTVEG